MPISEEMNIQMLENLLKAQGIDSQASFRILDRFNQGKLPPLPSPDSRLPGLDGTRVVDRGNLPRQTLTHSQVLSRLNALEIFHPSFHQWLSKKPQEISFREEDYTELGILLLPWVSIGILNGGLATSYCDKKKNQSANPAIFRSLEGIFGPRADELRGLPKGLAPAYYNQDGTAGYSFLYLRLRQALLMARRYRDLVAQWELPKAEMDPLFPFFQMTSGGTDEQVRQGIEDLYLGEDLNHLAKVAGIELAPWLTAVQPLLAAFTHDDEGSPKRIFLRGGANQDSPLGLPGGHGQNFSVLSPIYTKLLAQGKKFVYLGNVDNLGSLPDPGSLAYLALHGGDAGFDFSFKTSVDLKGGILIRTQEGRLTCADIGPSVKGEVVDRAVAQGQPVLFNCATGLFRLDLLVRDLPRISEALPVRFSNQIKDGGAYSQAEQVTWEVIGLLENPIILGVDKYRRFLAAKMLIDTFMTSGFVTRGTNPLADKLYQGLRYLLENEYGLECRAEGWVPKRN